MSLRGPGVSSDTEGALQRSARGPPDFPWWPRAGGRRTLRGVDKERCANSVWVGVVVGFVEAWACRHGGGYSKWVDCRAAAGTVRLGEGVDVA